MMMSASCCALFGPMSKIMSSSATAEASFSVAGSLASYFLPTTTSTAIGMVAPRLAIFSMSALAVGVRSGSLSDLPIFFPAAARKVLAMPPPTTSWSTFSDSDSSTVSLVETFEPPTIATIGRFGLSNALVNASSSPVSRMPAHATGANLATPWVEASARCAVPKASITNTSHSPAYFRAVSSAFFFSPLLKRTFSSNTSSPAATSKPPLIQSLTRRTGFPSFLERSSATGLSEFSSL